jgi:2-iminoacetate synthase ThiH
MQPRLFLPTPRQTNWLLLVALLSLGEAIYLRYLAIEYAQVSLAWGVDDLDGTVREERIYHMAGAQTPQEMTRADLVALIRASGRIPVERDTLYNIVAEA